MAVASRQHGAVAHEQLLACGVPGSTIRNWVARELLHPVHRAVYAVGRPDVTRRGRWRAAVLACEPDAWLSDAAAAALYGVRASASAYVDVTVTRGSSLEHPGIRLHRRDLHPDDVTEVDGIPVTSVARTLLDLAANRYLTEGQLERACEQAVVLELFDARAMSGLLARSRGARGIRKLRSVLARGDLGSNVPASGLERLYADMIRDAGLPEPELNRYLLLGDEYHQVDLLWRRERVVVEVDGARYHATGWQRERDARRDELLAAHGYGAGRVSEDLITRQPARAVAVAARLLATRPRR